MSALAVGLWPWVPAQLDIAKSTAFGLAFLTWVTTEWLGAREPHAHDLSLFAKIQTAIGNAERERLRSHDMAVAFSSAAFDGVFDISAWRGASAEFVDPYMQKKWIPLREDVEKLVVAIGLKTFPLDRLPEFQTVKTHDERGREVYSDAAKAAAKELNSLTSSVIRGLDELDRLAARRLKVALSS